MDHLQDLLICSDIEVSRKALDADVESRLKKRKIVSTTTKFV